MSRLKRLLPRLRVIIPILLIFTLLLSIWALARLTPLVVELAIANATDVITVTVNEVISEKVMDGNILYSDLVSLEKDTDGSITALVTNMAGINYLQAEITTAIIRRFQESDVTRVAIPIGNLVGGTLFSGRGPAISVDILSVTNVNTEFRNEFSSAGINQTRHRIVMDVDVTLGILLAGYADRKESIDTEITIAETVIVGSVPGTYANMK